MKLDKITTRPYIVRKMLAAIVDYGIIFIMSLTLIFTLGRPDDEGSYSLNGFPAILPVIFWGLMTIGIEQKYGSTIGNTLAKLKPISVLKSSKKLSLGQSVKRHLLDPVDLFALGLATILVILYSKKNQRLGDMWARTIVIDSKNSNEY